MTPQNRKGKNKQANNYNEQQQKPVMATCAGAASAAEVGETFWPEEAAGPVPGQCKLVSKNRNKGTKTHPHVSEGDTFKAKPARVALWPSHPCSYSRCSPVCHVHTYAGTLTSQTRDLYIRLRERKTGSYFLVLISLVLRQCFI